MNLEVDVERLTLAHKAVRAELLAERAAGHWTGQLSSSPYATAAAISALVIAHRRDSENTLESIQAGGGQVIEHVVQNDLCELLLESGHWLARQQNADGGWGDCVGAKSNLAATMMVQAAFRLTGIPAKYPDLMVRADDYVETKGGIAGLRKRFAGDKPLLAAILVNCALAGMVSWRQVPTMNFELACLPKHWRRQLQVFASRQATPIVLAVGRAKFHHDPPKNPISRLLRRGVRQKSLAILESLQASDDSFLASTPITAFVVMSLGCIGCQDHPIVSRGIEFLLSTVRSDSSWAMTPNLAVSNTVLAWNGLSSPPQTEPNHDWPAHSIDHHEEDDNAIFSECCCDWLLRCQMPTPNPLTQVPAGGWAASDSAGALPNASATAGALLALSTLRIHSSTIQNGRVERAADRGIKWLLSLQNEDGGWPTFYRDDSMLRFDAGGPDVTAQVLRALVAWRHDAKKSPRPEIARAIDRGWKFLESRQRDDGNFIPLWFGNDHQPEGQNPVCGTALVMLAAADLDRCNSTLAQRAARWLVTTQHSNGGWGPPRTPIDYSGYAKDAAQGRRTNETMAQYCSVEETSLAIQALLPFAAANPPIAQSVARGLTWLIQTIEQDGHRIPAIIGFSPSKLWYDERLYPLAFAAGALSQAVRMASAATPVGTHV